LPVSVRLDDGREIELPGGPDAALVLHGLTGSTCEVRPVAERLHAAGMRVLAPVMAGHGGAPEALRRLPFAAWVEQAERELQRIRGARRAIVTGLSMGAMVACALADRHPDRVHGLVLLSPALELAPALRLAALAGHLPGVRDLVLRKRYSDVGVPEQRRIAGLPGVPTGAITELWRLGRRVDDLLPRLRVPTLVVVGARDHTVTPAGARRLVRRIGAGAELVVLPQSAHLVTLDVERERCLEAVAGFVERLRAPYAAPPRPLTDDEHRRRR
jgi:carboxylesterase